MRRAATTASAAATASSTVAAVPTAHAGVRGQALVVRACERSVTNFTPNGSTVPVVSAAAILAAAQISALSAARPQQVASTIHPAAVPPGTREGRGPRARLIPDLLTEGRGPGWHGSPGACRTGNARGR